MSADLSSLFFLITGMVVGAAVIYFMLNTKWSSQNEKLAEEKSLVNQEYQVLKAESQQVIDERNDLRLQYTKVETQLEQKDAQLENMIERLEKSSQENKQANGKETKKEMSW